jgi:YhfZ C-terminal domain/Helix-turn-helix domain
MNLLNSLYTKKGLVTQKVTEDLLFVEVDERIPKIDDLSKKFNVGRGTIQSVLKSLEESGCIELEARGHLGTFLRKKNIKQLLQLSGIKNFIGVMPLPYSKKYEGMATALHEEFELLDLTLHIAFMRGAEVRIENVLEGRYDFTLVSKFAAKEAITKNKELLIVKEFGPRSYVSGHTLVFSDDSKSIKNGIKIGLDRYSTDQQTLTLMEVGDMKVEFVQLNYMHLKENFLAKSIDTMVWNIDEIEKSVYHIKPLSNKKAIQIDHQMSEAVCVVNKQNRKIKYLFNLLSTDQILSVQEQVVNGVRIPKY